MNAFTKIRTSFFQSNISKIVRCSIQTCEPLAQYRAKPVVSLNETNDLLKSSVPTEQKSDVADARNSTMVRSASNFFSTSIFHDELVSKFVNCMMYDGKKSVSERVMEETFSTIKRIQLEKYRKASNKDDVELDPLKIFHKAIGNVKPVIGVQTMRKKGKKIQVPYPLPDNRRRFLAIKWMLTTARNRPGNTVPMSKKLSKEILDAYQNEGTVIQKKIDYHKRAELLRAFAHYRWW